MKRPGSVVFLLVVGLVSIAGATRFRSLVLLGAPLQSIVPVQSTVSEPQRIPTVVSKLALADGTPVRLKFARTVSSSDVIAGETVDFQVVEELRVVDMIVIPKDSPARATITMAQAKRRMARGGNLSMRIDTVRLASGESASLRMVREVKGGGHTGAMVGGMVATGIVFLPAAPFFLFIHGKDVVIPKGTEVVAYVNGDLPLDPTKFTSVAVAATPAPDIALTTPQTRLRVTSIPSGADIELDGKFIGTTPTSVSIPQGEHSICVTKAGHRNWERKLSVQGDDQEVNAELEAVSELP